MWSYVTYGEMLLGSSLLVLLPSSGWAAPTLSGELPWWEAGGGAMEDGSPFNKGRYGHLWFLRCDALQIPPTSCGGEGKRRIGTGTIFQRTYWILASHCLVFQNWHNAPSLQRSAPFRASDERYFAPNGWRCSFRIA